MPTHFTDRPCGARHGPTTANFDEVTCQACRDVETTFGDEADGPAPVDADGIPPWADDPRIILWVLAILAAVILGMIAFGRNL